MREPLPLGIVVALRTLYTDEATRELWLDAEPRLFRLLMDAARIGLEHGFAAGAASERASIVAWLRTSDEAADCLGNLSYLASSIEAGVFMGGG